MDNDSFRTQLIRQREELQDMIRIAKESRSAVELDQSKVGRLSRMDALQKQAMSKEVDRRRQIELARIEAALERLEEDEFGYCINCGEEIEKERLELNPSLPQCSKCAE